MEYTTQQQEDFKREFAARRKRQLMVAIPFVALIAGFAAFARVGSADGETLGGVPLLLWAGIGLALIIGVLIFSVRNWRCPACDKYLGRNANMSFCPKCGVALR
jgi:hypothetical protein